MGKMRIMTALVHDDTCNAGIVVMIVVKAKGTAQEAAPPSWIEVSDCSVVSLAAGFRSYP